MSKVAKLEYIWLDGFEPTQSLRSKTLIRNKFSGKLKDCPDWSFDGSSTRQAEDGIRDQPRSRGLGDVYKRQAHSWQCEHSSDYHPDDSPGDAYSTDANNPKAYAAPIPLCSVDVTDSGSEHPGCANECPGKWLAENRN